VNVNVKRFATAILDLIVLGVDLAVFSGVTAMSETILCPKPDGARWHNRECLFGTFTACGVDFRCCVLPKKQEVLGPL
jgi:hypothetical protein